MTTVSPACPECTSSIAVDFLGEPSGHRLWRCSKCNYIFEHEGLSRCRKDTFSSLTGALRWNGRVLEQEWEYQEIETDELAGESRTISVRKAWHPVPEKEP